jgi:fluoroquinolone transport system permease protein
MFSLVLKHELRSMLRDRMYLFFVIYEALLVVISIWLIPYLNETSDPLATNITIIVLLLMSGIVFGAITGFTLLDDQDDGVLFSLKVTPINVRFYIFFKLLMTYFFSVIATLLIIYLTPLHQDVPLLDIILITLLASLQGPFIALVMNVFSSNKVEGFVVMKLTGLTLAGPILALFLTNWTEFLVGIFPGFWSARMLTLSIVPLNYPFQSSFIYFILGLFVNVMFITWMSRLYFKKHQL